MVYTRYLFCVYCLFQGHFWGFDFFPLSIIPVTLTLEDPVWAVGL